MTCDADRHATGGGSRLRLPAVVHRALRAEIAELAEHTIATVVCEVPAYTDAVGVMRRRIELAVEQTISVFLDLVVDGVDPETSPAQDPALDGAYRLGRGEAQAGRSPEMLLAAYRIGARTVWRQWSALAVGHRLAAEQLAVFAELIFAYMDRLSAAAVSGHAHESAETGLARHRAREVLARRLLDSAGAEELLAAAARAEWPVPQTLTALAVPSGRAATAIKNSHPHHLEITDNVVAGSRCPMVVLLIPDVRAGMRTTFGAALAAQGSVIGPTRPWMHAAQSLQRVKRALTMGLGTLHTVTDTDTVLPELVLGADADALADLRARVLAPLDALRPSVRDNLIDTLRAWVLHHGRREQIAAHLFVHPQTVRYRLGQLRQLYGDRLSEPRTVVELTVALAMSPTPPAGRT